MKEEIIQLPRLNLKGRQLYDLEMILVDGFDPLQGFMTEEDYNSVLETMRLKDGTLFPVPIILDVESDFGHGEGGQILLCDEFQNPLAIMDIASRFTPNKEREAERVYGTTDRAHPGVKYLLEQMHDEYIGGSVRLVTLPERNDFRHLRRAPDELKQFFKEKGWDKIIGFQTRNPMHRAHFELVKRAHEKIGAPVLVHPVVGMTKPGDIDYVTRVRSYNIICDNYGKDFMHLSLLPLAMRMAGPREALWHAIIRKNYGCTHFIVGRDHAGPGKDSNGNPFYGAYEARELAEMHAEEIGIEIVASDELAYSKSQEGYVSTSDVLDGEEILHISGTEFRELLRRGEDIPEWFSFPEVIEEIRKNVDSKN